MKSSSDGSKFRSVSTSHSVATDLTAFSSAPHSPNRKGRWDFTRLRPTPPLRPAYALIAKEVIYWNKKFYNLVKSQ